MNEDELRALVRDTIARLDARSGQTAAPDPSSLVHAGPHPSHYKYALAPADDRCVIEPGVHCNHCGYCLSHGH
jgi:hypothetical protein